MHLPALLAAVPAADPGIIVPRRRLLAPAGMVTEKLHELLSNPPKLEDTDPEFPLVIDINCVCVESPGHKNANQS